MFKTLVIAYQLWKSRRETLRETQREETKDNTRSDDIYKQYRNTIMEPTPPSPRRVEELKKENKNVNNNA